MVDSLAAGPGGGGPAAGHTDLVGLALAAGAGSRLRPLTKLCPKPLCPVGDRTLLDWGLEALAPAVAATAVNVHHGSDRIEAHLAEITAEADVHVAHEQPHALGTAGAVANLLPWIDGRGVLIVNADTWHRADLAAFAERWDGERTTVLTPTAGPFGPRSGVVASLLPWRIASTLVAEPSGLWERVWRDAVARGELDTVHEHSTVVDCATPADYLRANMAWSGGEPVCGAGSVVEGSLVRSVVWPGATVGPTEHLVDAIRTPTITVLVR